MREFAFKNPLILSSSASRAFGVRSRRALLGFFAAKQAVAFQPKQKNHPRNIKPHEKEQNCRKRAVNVGVAGVIDDIKDEKIFADIPHHRACKRSNGKHSQAAACVRA